MTMRTVWLRTALLSIVLTAALFGFGGLAGWNSEQLGWPGLGVIAVVCVVHGEMTVRAWAREEQQPGYSGPRSTRARGPS